MNVAADDGKMPTNNWNAAGFYLVFVFRKKGALFDCCQVLTQLLGSSTSFPTKPDPHQFFRQVRACDVT